MSDADLAVQQSVLGERHDSAPAAIALPSSKTAHKYITLFEIGRGVCGQISTPRSGAAQTKSCARPKDRPAELTESANHGVRSRQLSYSNAKVLQFVQFRSQSNSLRMSATNLTNQHPARFVFVFEVAVREMWLITL